LHIGQNLPLKLSQQKDMAHLQKKSDEAGKGFHRVAQELDRLNESASALREDIERCDREEQGLVSGFDEQVVYYNNVTANRYKHIRKEIKELRKKRVKALEELSRQRSKISELETQCEILAYRQGEVCWDSKLEAIKSRKWKG
jgi:chromosome segregation ATPase